MTSTRKRYEEQPFTNDYIFWRVMTSRPDLCQEVLEMILEKKIAKITYSEGQKTIEETPDGRGIRLDVYVEGEDEIYNIEMQASEISNLPKRTRYYQGSIDIGLLERNADFDALQRTYIIFICTFDPFCLGLTKQCH